MRAITNRAEALLFVAYVALLAAPRPAQAETLGTCVGFIETVPATITTQGTWCMRKDLSTAIASGAAITVGVNNVIIDCNDYKLGGLAAGPATQATGIRAENRINVRVRNCAIRGFRRGVWLQGAGHSVIDSRLDNNTAVAILITGDGLEVLRNTVRDTGGSTSETVAGIRVDYDGLVQDNHVHGVIAVATYPAYGIQTSMAMGTVSRNSVAAVQGGPDAINGSRGISNHFASSNMAIRDNVVTFFPQATSGWGILCSGALIKDNVVHGYTSGLYGDCVDGGGNVAKP